VDAEMREAFSGLHSKVDAIRKELADHRVEEAERWAVVKGQTEAAHRRIDSHKQEHVESRKWWGALWITAIGAAIAAALGWAKKSG